MSIDLTKPVSKITVDGEDLPLYHNLEDVVVVPSTEQQLIKADEGYDGIDEVIVQPIQVASKNITANGTYTAASENLDGYSSVSVNVGGDYFVKVVDYDGTIIDEKWLNHGDVYTLPTPPVHSRLTFEKWVSTQQVINNTVTIDDDNIMIGPSYVPASGMSEFDIELTPATGLSVTFKVNGNKDWGDGSTDTTTSHTYTNYGKYTIKTDGTTLTTSNYGNIFGTGYPDSNNFCIGVHLSQSITSITQYSFRRCYSLRYITFPSTTSLGSNCFSECIALETIIYGKSSNLESAQFYNCYSLKDVVLNYDIRKLGANVFYCCYSIKDLVLPSDISSLQTFITSSAIEKLHLPHNVINFTSGYNYSVKSINIPKTPSSSGFCSVSAFPALAQVDIAEGVTSLLNNFLGRENYCIKELVFPSTLTSLGAIFSSSDSCPALVLLDFRKVVQVPTLSSSTAFGTLNQICKIVVPDSLYNDWVAANNWSAYSDYIIKASDYSN